MNQFPDTFTRQVCHDILTKNQLELIKQVRDTFHKTTLKAVQDCDPEVVLEFPDKLWHEHRVTLIQEILERFGKIKIKTNNPDYNALKSITDTDDLPTNIKKVIIEFIKV
ncbi:hypothetical protein QKU48_gp0923 [Fadolivirus algeromassiliense]|jgi:hypothetical protein|uniref:Uncharacterized protein n=1 Tax=Fadolivirus FV1/VV64 TaxID=3070911 RepID=A0A7D3R1H4_9VIRU|nr:hypothetical protein QKU48_gp0923 [Fadolivirus algeromassiliense]QKF94381.1 hypothetical protein Fadolivirus_1_923 [Fadolivirus FV1/VV64]